VRAALCLLVLVLVLVSIHVPVARWSARSTRGRFRTITEYGVSAFTLGASGLRCQGGVERVSPSGDVSSLEAFWGVRCPGGVRPAGGGSPPGGLPHAAGGEGAGGPPPPAALGGVANPVEGEPAGGGAVEVREPGGVRGYPSLSPLKHLQRPCGSGGYRGKVAYRVRGAVAVLLSGGPERVGFLTLTFAEDVSPREASRRLNALGVRVLPRIGDQWVWVRERTKSGRLHYHLLIRTHWDIRSGFDFGQVKRGCYVSACPELRRIWSFLRRVLPRYGFGRHELVPVRDRSAIGRYVGKYVTKSERADPDKGQRLCGMTRGISQAAPSVRFAWVRGRSWVFRRVVGYLESVFRGRYGVGEALPRLWGPRWSWRVIRMVERSPRVVEEALAWWGA